MITYQILAGTVDVSVVIRIIDSTDGTPETGVVFNTSGIALEYRRELAASVAITEATLAALTTAHADGGFLHIGNGYYRLDLPDAACASGVAGVLVHGTVTGMIVIGCYINLTPVPSDVRQLLGTAMATPTVAGVPEVDVTHWLGTAAATPTVAGVPEVDVTHLVGVAQSATDLKDFADDGYDPSTNKVQGVVLTDTLTTYTGNTVQTGDSFARIGATGSGLTSLSTQASVNTVDDFLDTEIAAIKAVTDALPNAGALSTIQADLDNIQTRITGLVVSGTSDSGSTTTMVDAARTEADTDYWKGSIIFFTSGNISGQARVITGFTPASDTITFAPATTQTVGTQTYEIWPAGDYLRPTTSGRTLDVTTTGEAGVDWANVGSPTTTLNLSGTTISTGQVVASDTTRASQASVDTIDDFLDTEVAAILAAVDTEIAAIKAKTDLIPGTIDGKTFAELQTLMASVLLGKASGLATATAVFRAINDTKDRVTATVDANGNRTAVTLDAT